MEGKWGWIVGAAANKEWQCFIASRKSPAFLNRGKQKGLVGYLFALIRSGLSSSGGGGKKKSSFRTVDSVMSRYLALESGEFWFPAQVYNREVFLDFFEFGLCFFQIDLFG